MASYFTVEPIDHTHRWSVETIETPNQGTCALHKLEADVTWLGRKFYYAVVDTVYVKQSFAAVSSVTPPSATPAITTASATRHSRLDRESQSLRPSLPDQESRSGSPYVTVPEYQRDDQPGMSLSVQTVPGSVPYTVRTVTRPGGTMTTRRYDGIVSGLPLL